MDELYILKYMVIMLIDILEDDNSNNKFGFINRICNLCFVPFSLVSCIPPTQDDYIMPRIEPSSPTGPTVTFGPGKKNLEIFKCLHSN